jgi:D-sedoheptulose 7-phosphate isomerase
MNNMNSTDQIRAHFEQAQGVLQTMLGDEAMMAAVAAAADALAGVIANGGKVISCGNGGSMCDAMHFAEELTGRYRNDRKPFPAIAISDPSHLTCVSNDYGFEQVFARFVEAVGSEQDALLAISTSGASANVLRAAEQARRNGMLVVGLTGKDGGALAGLCDFEVRVPWSGAADRIQEVHIKCIHAFIDRIEAG